jgi:flavin reductase (DIM6/NTAB) family NADH-FMN oxidoreductase RutF
MADTFDALTHGCYVVTTVLDDRRYGMTCCWATQIDADKILLILGSQSTTARAIRRSRIFGVNVLTTEQKGLALHFGEGHSDVYDKFAGVNLQESVTGVPLLAGALKTIGCELVEDVEHQGGSSFVGRILYFRQSSQAKEPLLLVHIDG